MSVSFGGVSAGRGERVNGRMKVGEFPDGTEVSVPVMVVSGKLPGPTLSLFGAVHGNELGGTQIIPKVLRILKPGELNGTVVGVPIANPYAFNTVQRVNIFDFGHLDLDRVFPGRSDGYLSERLAYALFHEVVLRSAYCLDFHEGGPDLVCRYFWNPTNEQESSKIRDTRMAMSKAFGHGIPIFERMSRESSSGPGSLIASAGREGISVICPEIGGGRTVIPEMVEEGVQGTLNVLKHRGMLKGPLTGGDKKQYVVTEGKFVRPMKGGILTSKIALNSTVRSGETLARVLDPYGEVIETITAPFRSILLDIRHNPVVYPGDLTYHCGRIGA